MIIPDLFLIVLTLISLIFASITDIKIKEVPDWLSHGLIIIGLTTRLLYSLIFSDYLYLLYGMIGFITMLLLGNALYFTKQWGGGDAKLMMALGATLSTKPFFLDSSKLPFLATLFIYIAISGAFYGLIWTLVLIIKNPSKVKKEFKILLKLRKIKLIRMLTPIVSLMFLIVSFFISEFIIRITLIIIAILVSLYVYLYLILKSVEHLNFYIHLPITNLVEGDWLAEDIRIKDKIILNKKTTLNKKDIEKLKELDIKKVLIKSGIPFVPPFLIGTILALIFGNPFI